MLNGTDLILFFEDESVASGFVSGLGLVESEAVVDALTLYIDGSTEAHNIAESQKPDWAVYSIGYHDNYLEYAKKSNRDYYTDLSKRTYRWADWCRAKIPVSLSGCRSHALDA